MRFLFGSALWLAVAAFPNPADACSCMSSGPPCQNYFQVDAVFVGAVRAIVDVERSSDPRYRENRVSFEIERAFKGVQGAGVDIRTGMGGGDCGYEFKVGQRYLVYAYRDKDGALGTGICSRTRSIANAADDLHFIETLPPSGTGGRIYGTVTRFSDNASTDHRDRHVPVPFVHLQLQSASRAMTTQTDERGRYEIANVPPGTYELQAVPPAIFSPAYLRRPIELRDARACVVHDFGLVYDGQISGTLLGPDGQPAARVVVEAMTSERLGSKEYAQTFTAVSDSGGYFEFSRVQPGDYVIGVSLQRSSQPEIAYPKTFYPGTSNPADARVITIGEGNHRELGAFRLPAARTRRELTGRVTWPDGQPAIGAFVSLSDGERTWLQVGGAIKTDTDGRFRFTVFDGLSYIVSANYDFESNGTWRQVSGRLGPLVISDEPAPLQIALPGR